MFYIKYPFFIILLILFLATCGSVKFLPKESDMPQDPLEQKMASTAKAMEAKLKERERERKEILKNTPKRKPTDKIIVAVFDTSMLYNLHKEKIMNHDLPEEFREEIGKDEQIEIIYLPKMKELDDNLRKENETIREENEGIEEIKQKKERSFFVDFSEQWVYNRLLFDGIDADIYIVSEAYPAKGIIANYDKIESGEFDKVKAVETRGLNMEIALSSTFEFKSYRLKQNASVFQSGHLPEFMAKKVIDIIKKDILPTLPDRDQLGDDFNKPISKTEMQTAFFKSLFSSGSDSTPAEEKTSPAPEVEAEEKPVEKTEKAATVEEKIPEETAPVESAEEHESTVPESPVETTEAVKTLPPAVDTMADKKVEPVKSTPVNTEQAEEIVEQSKSKTPQGWKSHQDMSKKYLKEKKYDKAISEINKALEEFKKKKKIK